MDNNQLSGWAPNTFKFTKNLAKLDISYNLIRVLIERNLYDLNNLQEMNLTGNPFICNCDLLWFREWMNSTAVLLPDKESYICYGPEDWQGLPVLRFTKDKSNCSSSITKYVFVSKYAILGSVSAALFVSVISGIFEYRNRWRLRLRIYLLSKCGRRLLRNITVHEQRVNYGAINGDRDQGFYDSYTSCSENDNDCGRYDDDNIFGGDFKLYYNHRDLYPAE